jgi:uncharacterized membrane protein YccF (DUF307 family)
MDTLDLLSFLVSGLLAQLPVMLVCIVACALILTRKNKIAAAPKYALWGFGLAAGLGVSMPVLSGILQVWLIRLDGASRLNYIHLMWFVQLLGALLHAATYGLLLMAMLAPAKPKGQAGED